MARPRSDEARAAALRATVELLVANGVEGVTFEDVAVRSGVARSTLYRHFGTKQAMIVEAARGCVVELPTPDTGDLLDDLRLFFQRWKQEGDTTRTPELLPALLVAAESHPDLQALVLAVVEEVRRPIRTLLRLAQHRGEIGQDIDVDVALALLLGPFLQRRIIDRLEITDEFREGVLAAVVAALRSSADRVSA